MGKLLVLSDSHGNMAALVAVLRWAVGELTDSDMAVFLGDGLRELPFARQQAGLSCAWKRVRGNNDDAPAVPESDVFDFGGHHFYVCHGHHHSLYSNFDKLIACARSNNADAALFGHIHAPYLADADGILLVCPGGISRARSNAGETFAVIDCEPDKPLAVQFWGIDPGGEIRQIKKN